LAYSGYPQTERRDSQQRDGEEGPADDGMLVYWRSEQLDYLVVGCGSILNRER
jgi:hypothetical protein